MHLSEDDVRTKVVYEWLRDCPISPSEINIEFTIKIRLGRGIRTINSRADILVKNSKGDNLLIIEVKKPSHNLHQNDKFQALSYARALAEGNIAPFTILTNGSETLIYDSITGEEVSGNKIPSNHTYVENEFKVTGDIIGAYSEALTFLVSLSEDNLLEFCKGQAEFRMSLLKSNDLFSGKKYIPQTYVDRTVQKNELEEKLFLAGETWDVVLITGPPQHGKSSFVCNLIESYQTKRIPILFYPAISLKEGLLSALIDDFQWSFNSNFSIVQIAQRLNSILERCNQYMIIVIDGWNEMFDTPLRLNEECMRLNSRRIKVIISSTSTSLEKMLYDGAGNPEFVGSKVKLTKEQIRKLCSEPLQNIKDLGILQIGKFNAEEIAEAKLKYEKAFNVRFEEGGNLPQDPFYLRLASEQYANNTVPAFANRSTLIHNSLLSKGSRSNIKELELSRGLFALSEVLYKYDSPIKFTSIPELFNSDNLKRWCDAAILQELKNEISTEIDFYYSHDRDYSVAILYREWHNLFQESTDKSKVTEELQEAIRTEVGRSALEWFLSCPDYLEHLQVVFSVISEATYDELLNIFIQPLLNQVNLSNKLDFGWLEKYLTKLIDIERNRGIEESKIVEFIYAYILSLDNSQSQDHFEFWITILLKYDTSLEDLGPEECYMAQIFECEIEGYDIYDTSNLDIELFERLVLHSDEGVASRSALYLAYTAPYGFMENLIGYRKKLQDNGRDYESILNCACNRVIYYLEDYYYGTFCKGILIEAEIGDEYIKEQYFYLRSISTPIMTAYYNNGIGRFLFDLLNEIRTKVDINDDINLENPNQLKFDF